MKIAIASGKGGTGKTTVAANLALAVARRGTSAGPVQLVDCDVEEPNVHLFVALRDEREEPVNVQVPVINRDKCDGCGKCSDFCEFNAIVSTGSFTMVFPEMCHSCGGCELVCPKLAIGWTPRKIGTVTSAVSGPLAFLQGKLDVGNAMAPPVIRAVRGKMNSRGLVILDSPPGTSCPVINTIKGSDHVVLVTEPTPFGLHDLELAVEMVKEVGLEFSVVINRDGSGDDRVDKYCESQHIPILARIPDDRRIAVAYSRGELMVDAVDGYADLFLKMADRLGIPGPDGESE